ncbi:PIN domain-containing protein, partial [Bernardetia sp.]|uniref:PIN domain-containing protein n=1 Tax=Bernardetia sp. TaxID=1937974 RepID=UPI0025C1D081
RLFRTSRLCINLSCVYPTEMKSLGRQRKWSVQKYQNVNEWLRKFLIVPIESEDILEIYSQIDAYSQGKLDGNPLPTGLSARNMGKNDIWIAATAHILEATLITMDKDFEHLDKFYFDVITLKRN